MINLTLLLALPLLAAQDSTDPKVEKAKACKVAKKGCTAQDCCGSSKISQDDAARLLQDGIVVKVDGKVVEVKGDLREFLKKLPSGTKVEVIVSRSAVADKKNDPAPSDEKDADRKEISWQFEGFDELEKAIERAKKEKKLVFVGLSGAET